METSHHRVEGRSVKYDFGLRCLLPPVLNGPCRITQAPGIWRFRRRRDRGPGFSARSGPARLLHPVIETTA